MTEDLGGGYLSGLPEDQRDELTRVNAPGLTALREYLSSGQAVAFLGAGVSTPLYPLWDGLIGELVDAAADRLTPKEAATCRALGHGTNGSSRQPGPRTHWAPSNGSLPSRKPSMRTKVTSDG
jgi:hypothetical protein